MRYQSIWLRSGKLIIPTIGVAPSGIFLELDPVDVLEPTAEAVAERLADRFNRPMPKTEDHIPGEPWPMPVVVKAAGVKSWSTFSRSAICCVIQDGEPGWRITLTRGNNETDVRMVPAETSFAELGRMVMDALRSYADK